MESIAYGAGVLIDIAQWASTTVFNNFHKRIQHQNHAYYLFIKTHNATNMLMNVDENNEKSLKLIL